MIHIINVNFAVRFMHSNEERGCISLVGLQIIALISSLVDWLENIFYPGH